MRNEKRKTLYLREFITSNKVDSRFQNLNTSENPRSPKSQKKKKIPEEPDADYWEEFRKDVQVVYDILKDPDPPG
jgi:hypothetical protein